jgi:hypothetical protein
MTPEELRLAEARNATVAWKKWESYLSERQWGTVREDYSANGDAWNFFPHARRIRNVREHADGHLSAPDP